MSAPDDCIRQNAAQVDALNAKLAEAVRQRDVLRYSLDRAAEREALSIEQGENSCERIHALEERLRIAREADRFVLGVVKNMVSALRHEACNDDMPELSEELSGIISVIDAALSDPAPAPAPAPETGAPAEKEGV